MGLSLKRFSHEAAWKGRSSTADLEMRRIIVERQDESNPLRSGDRRTERCDGVGMRHRRMRKLLGDYAMAA
jgi:hypothetical protein